MVASMLTMSALTLTNSPAKASTLVTAGQSMFQSAQILAMVLPLPLSARACCSVTSSSWKRRTRYSTRSPTFLISVR